MRDDPHTVPTINQLVAWLDLLAEEDGRCAHAAGILRGRPGGRRTIDDEPALVRMADLLAEYPSLSVESVARRIALTVSSPHSTSATTLRLAKKYRRKFSNKTS
jgi:hypothetical protein